MQSSEEDRVNGETLRQLREARGWDVWHLARLSSLSVAQVQALESGGMDCFYSKQIKNSAARKLATMLGAPEAMVFKQAGAFDSPHLETFDHQGVPQQAVVNSRSLSAKSHSSTWMGYIAMTLSMVAVLVWWSFQHETTLSPRNNLGGGAIAKDLASPAAAIELAAPVEIDKRIGSNEIAGPLTVAPNTSLATAAFPEIPSAAALAVKPQEREWVPTAVGALADKSCPFDENVAVLEAANPTKSAEKVSLMLYKAGMLCVQDATGKVWQEDLKPWLGRTYFGKAPWKIHSPVLPQADVYFQGEKIRLASTTSRTIALNGKEFSR